MHTRRKIIFYLLLSISVSTNSKIIPFSENYDDMKTANSGKGLNDLAKEKWKVTGKVFDYKSSSEKIFPGNYLYYYGKWFPAPNNASGSFSGIGRDSFNDKNHFLNIFSDYNNRGAHEKGLIVNAIFSLEFKISKKDINKTIQFNFDAKRPEKINYGSDYDYSQAVGNACNNICIANAFIRILDPKNNWAISNYDLKDNTNLSQSEWSNHTLKLKINEGHEGHILQVGFETYATGDDNTGVYYDNVSLKIID